MKKIVFDNIDETVYRKTLNNGLQVILLPKNGTAKTYGFFVTNYGSNDLEFICNKTGKRVKSPEGIAHFLEHKMFDKGDYDVFEHLSNLGASANAFTNVNETAYLFTTTENVTENVETLIDFVQDPYFTDETVEREKGIITQEINMYQDNPDHRLHMGALQSLFSHHPVHKEVLGTIDSINQITKEDLFTAHHTFYHPANMTLFIAGNVDPHEMMDFIIANQANKTFSSTQEITRFIDEEPKQVAKKVNEITMPISTPRCYVSVKEHGKEIDRQTFQQKRLLFSIVLNHLFGKSGPFYEKLYEEGLIDSSFGYFNNTDSNFGYTFIGGNTTQPDQLANRIHELLLSTKDYVMEEIELERVKKRRVGSILRNMNSIEYITQQFISYDLRGLQFFDLIPSIQSITRDEVNKFIHEWIDEEKIATTFIKPE